MQRIVIALLLTFYFVQPASSYPASADSSLYKKFDAEIESIRALIKEGDTLYLEFPDSANQIWIFAEKLAQKAFKIIPSADEKRHHSLNNIFGEIYFSLGSYNYLKGKIQTASDYYLKARTYYHKSNNNNGEGLCLNNLGLIYHFNQSEYEYALKNYWLAYKLFITSGNLMEQATTLHNIADIYEKKGETKKALGFYTQSLEIRRRTGNGNISQTLFNLSAIYKRLNQPEKAKQLLYECLELSNGPNKDKRILAYTCSALGNFYFENGQEDSALYYGKWSFDISKKLNFPANIKASSLTLKNIYEQKGDWKQATFYLKQHIEAKDSLNNEELMNEFVRQQIKFDYNLKHYDDSVSYLMEQQLRRRQIRSQEFKINKERNFRNTAILLSLLFITSGWGLYRRSVLRTKYRQNQIMIESLETEQRLLRAQMNPHYIFNSLSVIQGMLLGKDIGLAKKYLQKFSALIRSVLELSSKKYVTLRDETESVRIYLELEKLRLKERLEFTIDTDQQLLINSVRIPPMLIQPFVENAIIHGISHREAGGDINITIRGLDGILHCTITDNGIGRAASEEINRHAHERRRSLATELSLKRIRSKTPGIKETGNILITDLFDSSGEAAGTKVELFIPVKTEK